MQSTTKFRVLVALLLVFFLAALSETSTSSLAAEYPCKRFDTGDKQVLKDRNWFVRAVGTIDESGKVEGNVITKCEDPLWGFSAASSLQFLDASSSPLGKRIELNSHGVNARWIPGYTSTRVDPFSESVDKSIFSRMSSAALTPVYGAGPSALKRSIDFIGKTLSFYWPLLLLALSVGCVSTFIDLYSFFGYRGTTATILSDFPTLVFVLANGLIAAILVYFALDKNSDINSLMPENSSNLMKTLLISFGVPLLLKSKLFNFGDARKPVGLVLIYDFALDELKRRLAGKIIDDVFQLSKVCDKLCERDKELPQKLAGHVLKMSELFLPTEQQTSLSTTLRELVIACQPNGTEQLIRVSAKTIGLGQVKKWIQTNYQMSTQREGES